MSLPFFEGNPMAVEGSAGDLLNVVVLLGAAVVAVPLFKKLGLGSVLGTWPPGWRSGRLASVCSPMRKASCTWPSWVW
jgi:hypothetical protein